MIRVAIQTANPAYPAARQSLRRVSIYGLYRAFGSGGHLSQAPAGACHDPPTRPQSEHHAVNRREAVLTEAETADLRAAVDRANRQPQTEPSVWVTFVGGPLDGMRVRIDRSSDKNPSAIIGWCQRTNHGTFVANYVHADQPGKWRFRDYYESGAKAAGRAEHTNDG